jgi:MFS family permease
LVRLIVGFGVGLAYLAGLNIVNAIAPADRRAETLSAFLVACYLGFSGPALGLGIAANYVGLYAAIASAAVVLSVVAVVTMLSTIDRARANASYLFPLRRPRARSAKATSRPALNFRIQESRSGTVLGASCRSALAPGGNSIQ